MPRLHLPASSTYGSVCLLCCEHMRAAGVKKNTTMKRMRSKRSPAWEYFELKNDNNDARCKICDALFKYNNSTTSLMYHLKNTHPVVVLGESSGGSQPTLPALLAKRKACDDKRTEGITLRRVSPLACRLVFLFIHFEVLFVLCIALSFVSQVEPDLDFVVLRVACRK